MHSQPSLADLYDHLWAAHHDDRFTVLDASLHPRGPSLLFALADTIGLDRASRILDLGCGRGHHVVALALRYGSDVVALDPLAGHLMQAKRCAAEAGVGTHVTVSVGRMEALPLREATVTFIWCRDVLTHAADVYAVFRECRRVLRPHHAMLLHTAFATDLLEPKEAARLYAALALQVGSMQRGAVEAAMAATGFRIVRSAVLGSELAEHYELQDGRCSRELLRLARLLRYPERFRRELGPIAFQTAIGLYHWVVYQLLGKISYHVFLLERAS
jgi:ubiquinone/menaquinone biosynthesis C-methylase UbiE